SWPPCGSSRRSTADACRARARSWRSSPAWGARPRAWWRCTPSTERPSRWTPTSVDSRGAWAFRSRPIPTRSRRTCRRSFRPRRGRRGTSSSSGTDGGPATRATRAAIAASWRPSARRSGWKRKRPARAPPPPAEGARRRRLRQRVHLELEVEVEVGRRLPRLLDHHADEVRAPLEEFHRQLDGFLRGVDRGRRVAAVLEVADVELRGQLAVDVDGGAVVHLEAHPGAGDVFGEGEGLAEVDGGLGRRGLAECRHETAIAIAEGTVTLVPGAVAVGRAVPVVAGILAVALEFPLRPVGDGDFADRHLAAHVSDLAVDRAVQRLEHAEGEVRRGRRRHRPVEMALVLDAGRHRVPRVPTVV